MYERFEPPKSVELKPEGVNWLRKAAEQGNIPAQWALAGMLRYGLGTDTEAVKWLRAAADHGVVDAQYELGTCYEQGEVVPINYPEAAKLYRKAAEHGHTFAQAKLAELYGEGKGVPRDFKEAYVWNFLAKALAVSNDEPGMPPARLIRERSLQQKDEEKLTESQIAEAQAEALRRLAEIAKRRNATDSAE